MGTSENGPAARKRAGARRRGWARARDRGETASCMPTGAGRPPSRGIRLLQSRDQTGRQRRQRSRSACVEVPHLQMTKTEIKLESAGQRACCTALLWLLHRVVAAVAPALGPAAGRRLDGGGQGRL